MSNPLPVVKRTTWCRHRTPFTDEYKVCKVGVDFHQFDRRNMPCLGESEDAKAKCPQYAGWTQEELEARETMFAERMNRIGIIRPEIERWVRESGNRSGKMPCPACKTGTLSYSMAFNGHVHARCSTDGCASWME